MAGCGNLRIEGETVARAAYDFDGFTAPLGGAMSSGELGLAHSDLKPAFGRPGVHLLTDDGRLLDLRFAEKELRGERRVVHVDVTGELPSSLAEWRVGPTTDPAEGSLARMPGLNVSASS